MGESPERGQIMVPMAYSWMISSWLLAIVMYFAVFVFYMKEGDSSSVHHR